MDMKICLFLIRKLRQREVNELASDDATSRWHGRYSQPGGLAPRIPALGLCAVLTVVLRED